VSLRSGPFTTSYLKWRHTEQQYRVTIIAILNYKGDLGFYSTVTVVGSRHDSKKRVVWPADTFKLRFKPCGRRVKAKTVLDRLLSDD